MSNVLIPANAQAAILNQATRVTHSDGNDQLLYFTSTSLLKNNAGLVFISDRTGHANLFFRNLRSGKEHQLTHNEHGILKSYVYFAGNPYQGFGKASVSLDPERGIVYYIQGREIRAVSVDGQERILAELPKGQMTAFTHVSADGTLLCIPTVDARALDDENPLRASSPEYDVDARIQSEGLSSYLRVYDTSTGQEIKCVPVPKAWVTHVQFSPTDSNLILYNHEWTSFDTGIRRLWLWDGLGHRRIRTETQQGSSVPRSRLDWTCHEMWERDGSAIIYHGAYHKGPAYIGRILPDGSNCVEIALPEGWHQYGHFTVGRHGQLITDGYFQAPGTDSGGEGRWITNVEVNWMSGKIDWYPLGLHRSSWSGQDAHPHPILDHAGENIYFTSDFEGKRAIYRFLV